MPLFPEKSVASLAEFVGALEDVRDGNILWFRGQSRARYRLVPSLARLSGDWIAKEVILAKRFKQSASALLPHGPRSEWEWLLLMQHHGVPTRLLDWTENPLAALYFATHSRYRVDPRSDGVVWVLDPVELNAESGISAGTNDLPILEDDPVLQQYTTSEVAASVATQGPVAVLAKRMFPRLVAQAGVFTVIHRDKTPLDKVRTGDLVGRIVVPRAAKEHVAAELAYVGITRLSLFPELESVAEAANRFVDA